MVRRQVEQALMRSLPMVKSCKFGFWRRGTFWLEWLTWLARTANFPQSVQERLIVVEIN